MTTTEQTLMDAVVAALTVAITGVAAAKAGNVGNGTIQNLSVASPAILGIYVATVAAGAATFGLTDPNGAVVNVGDPPAPFVGNIGARVAVTGLDFAMAQGTADFAQGDQFAITVLPGTSAGARVYAPRDWPAKTDLYPMIRLTWPEEHKESWGPNAPAYDTTTTIRVEANVASTAVAGDAGAAAALVAVSLIKRQIEVAIINNGPLYRIISEIVTVDSKQAVKAEGEEHIGELVMDFAMKFPQVTDDFAPVPAWPLDQIAIFGDLLNVADPGGTYTPPFDYAVTPAPRTVGPDGRVEVGAALTLETD